MNGFLVCVCVCVCVCGGGGGGVIASIMYLRLLINSVWKCRLI